MKKKILSLFFVLSMLMTFMPISVRANEYGYMQYGDLYYVINNNATVTITDCNSSVTAIVIPGEIEGLPVTAITNMAFCDCFDLANITIPDSVLSIGESAFYDTAYYNENTNWENDVLYIGKHLIKAKSSISDVYVIKDGTKSIAEEAFFGCDSLMSIIIPDSVAIIDDQVFCDCSSLESVTIPNSVTTIENKAFYKCSNLKNVTIPDSVTTIGNSAFEWCSRLTSITLPESVTTIGLRAFNYCYIDSVYISDIAAWCNIDFAYKWFGGMDYTANPMYYADKLYLNNELVTNVVIPNGVTNIKAYAFHGCDSLMSVTIPDSVTTIEEEAFRYCSSLTSVIIPNSVTTIGDSAFGECQNLTSVIIPNSVITIGNSVFSGCDSLTSVIIPDSITSIGTAMFSFCSNLKYITIPNSVTSIDDFAFKFCYELESVIIPNSVATIGEYAFWGCEGLTCITIPNSVTIIGSSAFIDCNNLTDVYYSGTQVMWDKINVGTENNDLLNATLHCSGIEPTPVPTYIPMTQAVVTKTETDSTWNFDVVIDEVYEGSSAYVAVYDGDNNLVELNCVLISTDEDTSVDVNKTDNASYAKVFVWTNGIQPTTIAERIELIAVE